MTKIGVLLQREKQQLTIIMKKISLLLPLIAFILYGCSGAGSKGASQEASSQESISQEATQETVPLIPMARATADDLPPVVLEGEGYHVEIPADEEGIECTPVSEERGSRHLCHKRYDERG